MLNYRQFLRTGIDLAPLGVERRTGADNAGYFCTPRGADVIGWAGVDGIHYCFVRGFGDAVFAVNPSNSAPDTVHVLARSFEDFLRLLLACGDAAYPEQAWMWDEARFDAELAAAEFTGEAKEALSALRSLGLTPMDAPWRYLRELQENFDASKLRFPPEMYDTDMNPAPPVPEWKVRADGGFPGGGRAARELPLGVRFRRGEEEWHVPSVYVSGKNVLVDLVRAVPREILRAYREKFSGSLSPAQQAAAEAENPFELTAAPRLTVNGETLASASGAFLYFDPDEDAPNPWMRAAIAHYALDASCGWILGRYLFVRSRAGEIRSASLTLRARARWLPCGRLALDCAGGEARFTHPVSGVVHTLHVTEWEEQTVPSGDYGFPQHCVLMRFTLSPELADRDFTVQDKNEPDERRASFGTEGVIGGADERQASFGTKCVIGGADGPTAIFVTVPRSGNGHTAVSSLHYDAGVVPDWHIRVRAPHGEDCTAALL